MPSGSHIFHGEIIYIEWPPELDPNTPYLSPILPAVPNSAKFCENTEIPQKNANSAAQLKIPRSTENSGP